MNKLITKSLEEKSVNLLLTMPEAILNRPEKRWITFIKTFVASYNTPPTIDRLEKEFNDFIPVQEEGPLFDIYLQEIAQRRNAITREEIIRHQETLRNGDDPYNFILDLTSRLSVPTSSITEASSFDVTEYLRKSKRYSFGFEHIDTLTGGAIDGDLIYLFGRPGSGKTSVLIKFIVKWALEGHNILVVSNEIRYVDLMFKVHATIAGVDQTSKRRGSLSSEDISKIRVAQHILSINKNLSIVTHPVSNVNDLSAIVNEKKVDIVCIDGVYLMSPTGKQSSDWKDLTEVSRSLKQLANNKSILVVGVVQGSRVNENGLSAAGVAGTDAFLQDTDILFGIQKESATPLERTVHFECIKNRNGSPGAVSLVMRFPHFDCWEFSNGT